MHVLGGASSGSVGLEIDDCSSVSPPSLGSDVRPGTRSGCHGGSIEASVRLRGPSTKHLLIYEMSVLMALDMG